MNRIFLCLAFLPFALPLSAQAQPDAELNSEPSHNNTAVTIGTSVQMLDAYRTSTPALIPSLDVTIDHVLTTNFGVRGRLSGAAFASDEIGGTRLLGEAGVFAQAPGESFTLQASALAGLEYTSMQHKDVGEPGVGPSLGADADLIVHPWGPASFRIVLGTGYRLLWPHDEQGLSHGLNARLGVGWSF